MKKYLLLLLLCVNQAWALNPLEPVKLDNPRDTMRTFMQFMNEYRKGAEKSDSKLQARVKKAVRTLNLNSIPLIVREEKGTESAIFLKEVIDRMIVINYDLIPDELSGTAKRWRLKGTEITIALVESGDRAGDYLFTESTVSRAREFYDLVKHLPYKKGSGKGAAFEEELLNFDMPKWAKTKYLIFANWQWLGLFAIILFGHVVKVVSQHLLRLVLLFTRKTKFKWDEKIISALDGPFGLVAACGFWLLALDYMRFDASSLIVLGAMVQIVFSVALIWAIYRLVDVTVDYLKGFTDNTETILDDNLLPLVHKSLRVFTVIFGLLILFQNLGINVMSVLAGLGLGGLAFALAAKDTCANLFGSIMIALDRPFRIGDWVVIDGTEGTVVEIGFRSTRIRTFYDSMISLPNSLAANASIDNYGMRKYRRIKAFFGLTYDTPPESVEAFIAGVKKIIQDNPHTRKDYFHVVFNSYQDSALEVMLYCFLEVPDWASELKERQKIYLDVLKLAKTLNVDFAFPTRSLHIESMPMGTSVSPS